MCINIIIQAKRFPRKMIEARKRVKTSVCTNTNININNIYLLKTKINVNAEKSCKLFD